MKFKMTLIFYTFVDFSGSYCKASFGFKEENRRKKCLPGTIFQILPISMLTRPQNPQFKMRNHFLLKDLLALENKIVPNGFTTTQKKLWIEFLLQPCPEINCFRLKCHYGPISFGRDNKGLC